VIHTGKEANAPAGVLFEVKRPTNKGKMITRENLKTMQELILYYFFANVPKTKTAICANLLLMKHNV
jgi:hypothetical protein